MASLSFLDQLAEWIIDQGAVPASELKVGRLIQSPDNQVAILGLPGLTLGDQRDVAELEFPRFQAIIRNVDYEAGEVQLRKLRTLLHGQIGLFLPNFRVLRIHADQEGGAIGDDDQGRFEWSINFATEHHAIDSY